MFKYILLLTDVERDFDRCRYSFHVENLRLYQQNIQKNIVVMETESLSSILKHARRVWSHASKKKFL